MSSRSKGALALVVVLAVAASCTGQRDQRNIAAKRQFLEGEAPPAPVDAPPAKVPDPATEPLATERVARMSGAEASHRLGAYRLERTWIVSSESGSRRLSVKEDAKVEAAKGGAFHVTFELGDSGGFEAYWFPALEREGGKRPALIHRDRFGRFRLREDSDADERRWRDSAWGPLRAVVDEFGGRMGFTRGVTETVDGRRATRFEVALLPVPLAVSEAQGSDATLSDQFAKVVLPESAVVARAWRERKRPVNLRGHILVDEATAVVVGAEVHGTIDVAAPQSTQPASATRSASAPAPVSATAPASATAAATASASDSTLDAGPRLFGPPQRPQPLEKIRLSLSLKMEVRGIGVDPPLKVPAFEPPLVRPRFDNERFSLLGMSKIDYFLIDRYEFPNVEGAPPAVAVSARDAQARCKALGKRLCTDKEFRKACNGDKTHMLYPYGSGYDPRSCNSEGDAVKASGAHPKCKTTWNVFDLTGNVAEWTTCKERDRDVETFCLVGGAVGDGPRARCKARIKLQDVKKTALAGFRCCR